jgi:hypothetical protein
VRFQTRHHFDKFLDPISGRRNSTPDLADTDGYVLTTSYFIVVGVLDAVPDLMCGFQKSNKRHTLAHRIGSRVWVSIAGNLPNFNRRSLSAIANCRFYATCQFCKRIDQWLSAPIHTSRPMTRILALAKLPFGMLIF